ncbi:hypothetical protein [Janthinobacterium fluminis]|uniref:Uncharacterized protein n=1 Tax=Janthinobacterium fluminis TaxID=2987524 RepID=A0ABT5JVM6_9BURK|nr:hypothetical protein [Janthinobacterium fluminis]MDC8756235.1 hypothetical protein [Janthinobacterium fluminis]
MRRLIATLPLLLATSFAGANDKSILRDACVSLKSPTKRAACLDAVERLASGGVTSTSGSPVRKKSTEEALIAKAQEQIVSMLNDPESARFSGVAVSPSTGAVCGIVNAKNAMGGYGDPRRYIVTTETARLEDADKWKMDFRWSELCSDI